MYQIEITEVEFSDETVAAASAEIREIAIAIRVKEGEANLE